MTAFTTSLKRVTLLPVSSFVFSFIQQIFTEYCLCDRDSQRPWGGVQFTAVKIQRLSGPCPLSFECSNECITQGFPEKEILEADK